MNVLFLLWFSYAIIGTLGTNSTPKYTFLSKVNENGKITVKENGVKTTSTVKKVYWYLIIDDYSFRVKKKHTNKRVTGNTLR